MIKAFCSLLLKISGWKYVNTVPENLRSFIFLGAPHTSNHDFVPAMGVAYSLKRNAKFVIKSEWLKFPLGFFLKSAGAIGIDREKLKSGKASNTDLMANLFTEYPELVLMISPEGTRSPNENWKTGFYYIAQKAKVPIVLGFADYENKTAGTGLIIYPEDFETDMKKIMDFFRDIKGKRPENFKLDSRYL